MIKKSSLRWYLLLLPLAFGFATSARADCSEKHIRALHDKGKTVAAIAEQCGMSRADVSAALKSDSDDDDQGDDDIDDSSAHHAGLPPGSRIVGCGCWGYVPAGAGQPNRRCASGYEEARACPAMCPAGGAPWARVCQ
jgi:hypothetical protein